MKLTPIDILPYSSTNRPHSLTMVFKLALGLVCVSLLSALTFATPALDIQDLEARQAPPPDNIVSITDANAFWQVPYPYYVQRRS